VVDAVAGESAIVAPGRLVVIGEMHGTEEFPALIGALATDAARRGPVTVHLELLRSEQPRIDRILAGEDAAPGDGMWTDPFQSGRTSRAMWSLLVRLAQVARRTGRLRVHAMDGGETTGQARDRGMATSVAADMRAHPGDVHLALVGNLHSRVQKGTPFDPELEPFAHVVKQGGIAVTSLLGAYTGGTIWACASPDPGSCGVQEVDAMVDASVTAAVTPPALVVSSAARERAHDGNAFVGELHASPPAAK
jgi:hypothetical protein